MMKRGFTLIEVLVSLLIISAVGMSSIYVANGYLKNTHLRDTHAQELVRNIDTVEKLKATVKTKTELTEFADAHTDIILTEITDSLCKVTVGSERKLTFVMRVGDI